MKNKILPLREMSIAEVCNGEKATYEIPIYQRNYAWEKEEISTLVQDVYDAFIAEKQIYFVGTLVSFCKGEQVYEVIDGQQRLTAINLILSAFDIPVKNKLTYKARKKSNDTIAAIPDFEIDEKDYGIVNGFKYAKIAIDEIITSEVREEYKKYFQNNVHIIHYQVPKDIDLNHYFEIMNSRGEQLEKHEIIKARLIQVLNKRDKAKFSCIWEYCSAMNVYIQQKYSSNEERAVHIFGKHLDGFVYIEDFDKLPDVKDADNMLKISELINAKNSYDIQNEDSDIDTFQPIIDFPNFLLIVLKLTRMEEKSFKPENFNLDDKELLNEFDKVNISTRFVKKFGYNLLMAKYFLDNYIIHHSNEDDTVYDNPWKLQYWHKEGNKKKSKAYPKNLMGNSIIQDKLVHILSMFEVSFAARQRKNYLFYCLLYLFRSEDWDLDNYYEFVRGLADKYFKDVYLDLDMLNESNVPKPGSFDAAVLFDNELDINIYNNNQDFVSIYGDGTIKSKGIPLFIFNYLDYRLWEKYADELSGKNIKEGRKERNTFFASIGCSDFGLKVFEQFYFSRTRRSLEHYYPQANADGKDNRPDLEQINCLGNYAMIGNEANSSGSNWSPKVKLDHYLDASGKIRQVSVASIKFMIMMQKCKDNQDIREYGEEWNFEDIKEHQEKILEVLFDKV